MSYYTRYNLTAFNHSANEFRMINNKQLQEAIRNHPDMRHAMSDDGSSCESVKWYDHESDVKELSKKFPTVIFRLEGNGESGDDDMWYKYFLDGKIQIAKATLQFDAFDPEKLI